MAAMIAGSAGLVAVVEAFSWGVLVAMVVGHPLEGGDKRTTFFSETKSRFDKNKEMMKGSKGKE